MADDDYPAPPPGLTPNMIAYCHGVLIGSYSDAYRAAYNPSETSNFGPDIWRLNRHPKVAQYILALQVHTAKKLSVSREWLLSWWWMRATYDPAEITAWAIGACRYCHGDGHNYQWREPEFMDAITEAEISKGPLPDCSGGFGYNARVPPHVDCPKCDGKGIGRADFVDTRELSPAARAGFEGVKQTRDGIEIKMADKGRAAEQFAKLAGWDVIQVRNVTEAVPGSEELEKIAGDPIALAAAYKRMMTGSGAVH